MLVIPEKRWTGGVCFGHYLWLTHRNKWQHGGFHLCLGSSFTKWSEVACHSLSWKGGRWRYLHNRIKPSKRVLMNRWKSNKKFVKGISKQRHSLKLMSSSVIYSYSFFFRWWSKLSLSKNVNLNASCSHECTEHCKIQWFEQISW